MDAITLDPAARRVTIPGGMAAFTCYARIGNITAVQWRLNDTRAETFNHTNVLTDFIHTQVGNLGSLILRHIPLEWNNTRIRCEGTFESGTELTSGTCTLLLQGSKGCMYALHDCVKLGSRSISYHSMHAWV